MTGHDATPEARAILRDFWAMRCHECGAARLDGVIIHRAKCKQGAGA